MGRAGDPGLEDLRRASVHAAIQRCTVRRWMPSCRAMAALLIPCSRWCRNSTRVSLPIIAPPALSEDANASIPPKTLSDTRKPGAGHPSVKHPMVSDVVSWLPEEGRRAIPTKRVGRRSPESLSERGLRLILAEAALAGGDMAGFIGHIKAVRTPDTSGSSSPLPRSRGAGPTRRSSAK